MNCARPMTLDPKAFSEILEGSRDPVARKRPARIFAEVIHDESHPPDAGWLE